MCVPLRWRIRSAAHEIVVVWVFCLRAGIQESEAETLLLQSQLEYAKAQNELNEAIGTSTNE
jgi:hypothetical protein